MIHDRLSRFYKASADDLEWQRLMDIADELRPVLRRAFLQVVRDLRSAIDGPSVLRWIEQRSPRAAADEIVDGITGAFDGLRRAMAESIVEIGPKVMEGTTIRFDLTSDSPRYTHIINSDVLGPVREVSDATRDAIAQRIEAGLRDGKGVSAIARDLRGIIGLTQRQQSAVDSYRALLERNSPQALTRALRDKRLDAKILRAIANKTPLSASDIDKAVARYEQRMLNYRADTIARTESLDAMHAAQRLGWQLAIDDGRVNESDLVRFWHVARVERTCPICSAIPGLNPDGVGFNRLFDTPIGPFIGPTIHPDCRCVVFVRISILHRLRSAA